MEVINPQLPNLKSTIPEFINCFPLYSFYACYILDLLNYFYSFPVCESIKSYLSLTSHSYQKLLDTNNIHIYKEIKYLQNINNHLNIDNINLNIEKVRSTVNEIDRVLNGIDFNTMTKIDLEIEKLSTSEPCKDHSVCNNNGSRGINLQILNTIKPTIHIFEYCKNHFGFKLKSVESSVSDLECAIEGVDGNLIICSQQSYTLNTTFRVIYDNRDNLTFYSPN